MDEITASYNNLTISPTDTRQNGTSSSSPPMRLVILNHNDVQSRIDEFGYSTDFNTSFHSAAEAPDLPIPIEEPYHFVRWVELILHTRNLPLSTVQPIQLTPEQAKILVYTANGGSILKRDINRIFIEELDDEIIPLFENRINFHHPYGIFVRLDACSPKDGAYSVPGKKAIHDAWELVLRLVTSMRARNALQQALYDHAEIDLWIMPFDSRMNSAREYRVFCPPSGGISAISQYKWHDRWMLAGLTEQERGEAAQRIYHGAKAIHGQILEVLERRVGLILDCPIDATMREQGFTFDLLYDEEREACELIELNTFGARSPCGSCLFHWMRDREVLYGGATAEKGVEFRVSI